MRQIKYILINDSVSEVSHCKSGNYTASNLGHHYVINSQGMLLHPIDDSQPGAFMPKPTCGQEDLNKCSIAIKYNGDLARDLELSTLNSSTDSKLYTLNSKLAKLIALLLDLRDHYPSAKILGKDEYDRYHIRVSDEMNLLRRELSDYL